MSDTIELHLFSGELIIENSHPEIEDKLHYWHKHLVDGARPGQRVVEKEKVQLFAVTQETPVRRIITFQGFADRIAKLCNKQSLKYLIKDRRRSFPGAKLKLTSGFRGSQFAMFIRLMQANRSGILKAPTRYGKTTLLINALRAFPGVRTVLTAPEADLLGQLVRELQAALPDREIRGIFEGSKGKRESEDITVVSMDSLHKVNHDLVQLVLVDEPHAVAAPTRIMEFQKFKHARIYGFGASTSGRFDGADKIIEGLIGPVLVEKTFREAVAEKMICPIVVYLMKIKFDHFVAYNRLAAYNRLMLRSERFYELVANLSDRIVPADWQTLIFIQEVKQCRMADYMHYPCVKAVASKMTKTQRKETFQAMVSGETKRCLATKIYSTGVTFPDLRCIINTAGGGGSITGTQKPGRLAQNQPGKKAGYLIDFLFDCNQQPYEEAVSHENEKLSLAEVSANEARTNRKPAWWSVVKDCQARREVYTKLGYDVRVVSSVEEIKLT